MTSHPTRRTLLLASALLPVGAVLAAPAATAAAASPAATAAPTRVDLPVPPGPYRVGTTAAIELVDHHRRDPFALTPCDRAVVVQVWYPAAHADWYTRAPYWPAAAAAFEEQSVGLPVGTIGAVHTRGHLGAPPLPVPGGWPVLLFSPGSGTSRCLYTTLVEDLASWGYAVVAIDHPYDADVVEFPDGHLVLRNQPAESEASNTEATRVRAEDTRFVVDRLPSLDRALRGTLDTRRVAMFGHSMGGATAAWAMLLDRRIAAGVNLDGTLYGPVVNAGLDRPFLLMSSQYHDRTGDVTWAQFWSQLSGWHRELKLANSGHLSYSDIGVLAAPLHLASLYPPDELPLVLGSIDGLRAADVEQTYLTAYADHVLRRRPAPLLDGPDPRYPEVRFED